MSYEKRSFLHEKFQKKYDNMLQEQEEAKKTSENEGGAKDKWTIADFKDQIEDWKKSGLDDEKKLQGMIDKATEIAKKSTESAPGKATRAEVLGIMQRFMQKEDYSDVKLSTGAFLREIFRPGSKVPKPMLPKFKKLKQKYIKKH